MSTTFPDAHTDEIPIARHAARSRIPRLLRTFAVPVILGWIALIALLNVVVPQLEVVGKMRSVSMSPDDA
ncbi:MAG: putative drug exporter of the superfamily, partial [Mycobacterium sp.]|nr:putative drug exporter of the superfamily [Mycobacterium sp.]